MTDTPTRAKKQSTTAASMACFAWRNTFSPATPRDSSLDNSTSSRGSHYHAAGPAADPAEAPCALPTKAQDRCCWLIRMSLQERYGKGGQCGVHHDPYAQWQCALVEIEGGLVQIALRVLTGPDTQTAHRPGYVLQVPAEVLGT